MGRGPGWAVRERRWKRGAVELRICFPLLEMLERSPEHQEPCFVPGPGRTRGGLGWLQHRPTEQFWSPKQHSGLGVPTLAQPRDAPCQGEGLAPAWAVRWQQLRAGKAGTDASRSIQHLSLCSWGLFGPGCQQGPNPNALCCQYRGCSARCWSSHGAPGVLVLLGVPSMGWQPRPCVPLGSPTLLAHV